MKLSPDTIGVLIAVGAILVAIILTFIKVNLVIAPPNELLIFSGKKRRLKDGTIVGYRVIKGGRGLKIPIVESVSRMSLNIIPLDMGLIGTLTKGLIPLDIDVSANVKIAGTETEGITSAIERFLGRNVTDISQVAKHTIEGSLRGVLSTLTPEEANENRIDFAAKVSDEAQKDLKKLGLVLDTFKINKISDGTGYLENIGRKRSAEVRRDALISESESEAEARVVAAEAKRKGSVAEHESDIAVIEAENKLRIKKAQLATDVNSAESKALVASEISKITEETKLEDARIKRNQKKYEAETIIPARAQKEASLLLAKGEAAQIVEDGKAMAEAIKVLREEWEKEETRELYLIQQLPYIIDKVTSVIKDNLQIDKVTILDGGDGNGIPSYVKGITGATSAFFEGIKSATGLDITEILSRKKVN